MRWIRKNPTPRGLRNYREQIGASYNGMDKNVRIELISSLINEQSGVCAYCQRTFKKGRERITIEHHCEQTNDDCNGVNDPGSDRTMDYLNMLAVCDGKDGKPGSLTCDSRKGQIKWNDFPGLFEYLLQRHCS